MRRNERPVQRWRHLVQGKLRRQVTLPAVLGIVQLVMAAASLSAGDAPMVVLVWLVPALLVGWAFGRLTRVAWNTETAQAVLVGGQVILSLAWLAVQVGSRAALTRALADLSYASTITLLLAAGLAIGHALALLTRIGGAVASPNE